MHGRFPYIWVVYGGKCKHIHHTLSLWDNEGSVMGHLRDMDTCFVLGGDMFVGILFFTVHSALRLAHAMDPRQQMSNDWPFFLVYEWWANISNEQHGGGGERQPVMFYSIIDILEHHLQQRTISVLVKAFFPIKEVANMANPKWWNFMNSSSYNLPVL